MTTPVGLMQNFRAIVNVAAPDLTAISIGAVSGKELIPYASIRSTGGPEAEAQVPEANRRIDVNVFAKDTKEAYRLSDLIHDAIRQHRNGSGTIQLPSIFSAGGPLDFQDEDRRLPAVFRGYYVIYGESV